MRDLINDIEESIKKINSDKFKMEIKESHVVPTIDNSDLTYTNFDSMTKKVALIKTSVLFIDIRKSTKLSFENNQNSLSKLYSSFISSMLKACEYFGGKVRNIVGDRIMVVFDSWDINNKNYSFVNAIKTAILLNTISNELLNKYFKEDDIKCGIGIDYGEMMVNKVGTVKHGSENREYKSLVWLGKPANFASKLTDYANKDVSMTKKLREVMGLEPEDVVKGKGLEYPILISEEVYKLFKEFSPESSSIINNWWYKEKIEINEQDFIVYGGNINYDII